MGVHDGPEYAAEVAYIRTFSALFGGSLIFSVFGGAVSFSYGAYSWQRIFLSFLLVILTTFGLCILFVKRKKLSLLSHPVTFITSLSFLVHGFYSISPFPFVEPLLYIFFVLAFVFFGEAFACSCSPSRVFKVWVIAIAISIFFYAGTSFNYYVFSLFEKAVSVSELLPWGFVNIRYWSHLATWLLPILPLALIILPFSGNRLWRLMIYAGGAVWVWIIILSQARGSVLGLFCGTVVVIWMFRGHCREWLRAWFFIVGLGVLAWIVLSMVVPHFLGAEIQVEEISSTSSGRIVMWEEALTMSLQNFPFGMGAQSWLTHEPLTEEYRNSIKLGHPHNMFLMWAAEYGWITVGLLVCLCVGGVGRLNLKKKELISKREKTELLSLVAITASMTAGLVHSSFSALFIAPASLIVSVFLFSYFVAATASTKTLQTGVLPSRFVGIASIAVVGACVVVAYFWVWSIFEYREAMISDLPTYLDQATYGMPPRFWHHGLFPRPE